MDKTDLKHLNAILKELYITDSQVDIDDFCEYRLDIKEPNIYLKYTDWLLDQGYARTENNPKHFVRITAKGRSKYEKGGLKIKDLNPKVSKSDEWLKWLKIAGAIIALVTGLYKGIEWLMDKFF